MLHGRAMAQRKRSSRRRKGRVNRGLIAVLLLAIVAGGLLLGMLGGRLVDPVMKREGEGIGGKDPNAAARQRSEDWAVPEDIFNPFPDERDDAEDEESAAEPPSAYRPDLDYEEEQFGTSEDAPVDLIPPAIKSQPPAPRPSRAAPARQTPAEPAPTGETDLPAIY